MVEKKEVKEKTVTMRTPFALHLISKLPKGTKAQNECAYAEKAKCDICGGFHHPKVIHLDYVGHAALTDRLLDVDPSWNWEPLSFEEGLPKFDNIGGLWIRLTVLGTTRLGYGNAEKKTYMDIGAREKEVIGDALRNAAMRFGAALDLWHKGDLHRDEEEKKEPPRKNPEVPRNDDTLSETIRDLQKAQIVDLMEKTGTEVKGILDYFKCKNLTEMSFIQAEKCIKLLKAKPDKKEEPVEEPTEEELPE